MRSLLLFFLLLSTAAAMIYSCTCRYDWAFVYEKGYATRPLTPNEKNQLINYGQQYAKYVSQMTHGVTNAPPSLPCFCHTC